MPNSDVTIGEVERALVAFEDALSVELPASMATFSQARVALAKVVNTYILGEGERMALMRSLGVGDATDAEQEAIYKALIALKLRYSEHISRWSSADIVRNWVRYRSDSVSLIVGMRKLLKARAAVLARRAA